ncbi:MAG: adenine phosphoribosyltransferase [Planctomycetes bacterium]|nr:adenine phosphoribosyltransferase [Planctomycetota bacterium]
MKHLKRLIAQYPNFPKKGILFKDISPCLASKKFPLVIKKMAAIVRKNRMHPDYIVSPEARGFIFGAALAFELKCGFIMARKINKLPGAKKRAGYALEYGVSLLEIPAGIIKRDNKVLIVDDVVATGGTVEAIAKMIKQEKGKIMGLIALMELTDIPNKQVCSFPKFTLLKYNK